MGDTLFSLKIEQQGDATAPGSITVTRPADRVYLLTFESPPDNRLSTNFINPFLLALDIIEHRYKAGVVITTSSIQKFYSNGMDLGHVAQKPHFFPDSFYPLFRRIATYPMPTVALINGHAFAGGFILAMYHDYRLQNADKGFLSLNEILFGALLQPPMISVFREKVDAVTFRDMVLEGRRFPAQDSLKRGLIDGIGGLNAALEFIAKRSLVKMSDAGTYGQMKEDMWRASIDYLTNESSNQNWRNSIEYEKKATLADAAKKVEEWEKKNGKAKL